MGKCYASTAISLAKEQIGYKETGTNVTTYASDFDTKYPDFYNYKKHGVEWCDIFFDWIMVTAFSESDALRLTCQPKKSTGAGTVFSYDFYEKKGQVGSDPKLGSQIFFCKCAKKKENICHTGIVVGISENNVQTVEGNKNNQVSLCTYAKTDSKIFGYGYPAYDDESEVVFDTKKSNEEVAKEVIEGKWGNGQDRINILTSAGYDAKSVQTIVNNMLKSPTKTYVTSSASVEYKVTANSGLRIRTNPDDSDSRNIICVMPKESTFVVSKKEGNWAFGTWNTYSGWSSLAYLVKK